jgi:hypothetical protein
MMSVIDLNQVGSVSVPQNVIDSSFVVDVPFLGWWYPLGTIFKEGTNYWIKLEEGVGMTPGQPVDRTHGVVPMNVTEDVQIIDKVIEKKVYKSNPVALLTSAVIGFAVGSLTEGDKSGDD